MVNLAIVDTVYSYEISSKVYRCVHEYKHRHINYIGLYNISLSQCKEYHVTKIIILFSSIRQLDSPVNAF